MEKIAEITQWDVQPDGSIRLRGKHSNGSETDLIFAREAVPAALVLLNRLFMSSADEFQVGFKELVLAHVPLEFSLSTLPNNQAALVVLAQSGMKLPFAMSPPAGDKLSEALASLRPILDAERQGQTKH